MFLSLSLCLDVLDGCYSGFDSPDEVINTVPVGGALLFAELWHGPTGAFKDLSLVVLARVVDLLLRRRGQRSVVLVSTSGDTGSAAAHSVVGVASLQLVVLYPRDMVTRTQELQMTTVQAPNVHVFSVDGTSDDGDVVMATLFADSAFSKKHNLNVFNSLNVCRVLVQAVHFVHLYLRACPEADQDVLFCVPTGGLGNISSGMVAKEMGFPLRFLAAVNANDCVCRTLATSVYQATPTVQKTLSCAMDISVPYNMERIFYYLSGHQADTVATLMRKFDEEKSCRLPESFAAANNSCITSVSVSESDVIRTMRQMWQLHRYLVCPHTAVATKAALDVVEAEEEEKQRQQKSDKASKASSPLKPIVVCTATPAKFAEAVKKAGLAPPTSQRFDGLERRPERKCFLNKGEDWCKIVRQKIEQIWN